MTGKHDRLWRDVAEAVAAGERLQPAQLEPFADEMKRYYDELIGRGFSERQATHMVTHFQTICLVLSSADSERRI